jgi:hypothetical protein
MTGDFIELLERLVRAEVDFVIVGGFAGTVYGCTMVTQDVDICCDFSPANLLALQKAIANVHPVHRTMPGRKELELTERNCRSFKNLCLDTDIGRLDCFGSIGGVGDYQKVKEKSVMMETGGVRLQVLSLDALIESKRAMNRPRDIQAITELEAIRELRKDKK